MRKYNSFHIPVFSFFSGKLYRDVSFRWRGTCLGYYFLLLLVSWLVFIIKLQISLIGFVNTDAPKILKEIPDITITNGKLSIDKELPYSIVSPEDKKTIVLFDTNEAIDRFNNDDDLKILVTPDMLLMKRNKYETRTYEFKQVKSFSLDEKRVQGWLSIFQWVLPLAFFLFGLFFSVIYRLIQLLIYAGIGMLFSLMLGRELNYLITVRLTCVAVTPVIVLTTLTELVSLNIPFFWLLCFLIAMGYLFFGVFVSVPEPVVEEEETPNT